MKQMRRLQDPFTKLVIKQLLTQNLSQFYE